QRGDALVVEIAFAQVEAQVVAEHLHIAGQRWLVEAIELVQLFDLRRVDAYATTVGPAAAGAILGARIRGVPIQRRHQVIDRAAWKELCYRKSQGKHADKRRNHDQQTLEEIQPHNRYTCSDRALVARKRGGLSIGSRDRARGPWWLPGPLRVAWLLCPADLADVGRVFLSHQAAAVAAVAWRRCCCGCTWCCVAVMAGFAAVAAGCGHFCCCSIAWSVFIPCYFCST